MREVSECLKWSGCVRAFARVRGRWRCAHSHRDGMMSRALTTRRSHHANANATHIYALRPEKWNVIYNINTERNTHTQLCINHYIQNNSCLGLYTHTQAHTAFVSFFVPTHTHTLAHVHVHRCTAHLRTIYSMSHNKLRHFWQNIRHISKYLNRSVIGADFLNVRRCFGQFLIKLY